MRQLTEFERRVLVAVGVTRYNSPGTIASRIGKSGNAGAIVVSHALGRLQSRGFVTYQIESPTGDYGWELTNDGANECNHDAAG